MLRVGVLVLLEVMAGMPVPLAHLLKTPGAAMVIPSLMLVKLAMMVAACESTSD